MTSWTLVFHILGFVFWIGSLMIVTNMLGRHAEETAAEARQAFGRMEMRLLNGMANPGAVLTIVTGIILIYTNPSYYLRASWLHAKLVLVVILMGLHWVVLSRAKAFVAGRIDLQRRDWMTLHGAVTLIFLGILILVLPGQFFLK